MAVADRRERIRPARARAACVTSPYGGQRALLLAGVAVLALALLLVLASGARASSWELQAAAAPSLGDAAELNAVFALEGGTVWVAGAGKAVHCSHDGGRGWAPQASGAPQTPEWRAVHFLYRRHGFGAGADGATGLLYATADAARRGPSGFACRVWRSSALSSTARPSAGRAPVTASCSEIEMGAAASSSEPHDLDFAFSGTLTAPGTRRVAFGRGSITSGSYWWLGGPAFTKRGTSGDPTLTTTDGAWQVCRDTITDRFDLTWQL